MRKMYLYGYLNRIQSSRRLEREAKSNLELMWLVGRLAPDVKTIANFRKDNGPAIGGVCREFLCLCRRLDLLSQSIVAIDGSKCKAVNSRERNFTVTKRKLRLEQIEESAARYLSQLDTADRQEWAGAQARVVRREGKRQELKEEMRRLKKLEVRMLESPDKQILLTDPDARAMTSKADGRFGKQDFVYPPKDDQYRCPAGQRLTWHYSRVEDGMTLHIYWTTVCPRCPLKSQCTTGSECGIKRWEHEAVVDALQERMDRNPDKMQTRRQSVEHPFGTLKAWRGATHFLTKTLPKGKTEMSLHVLAYNRKRMMQILTPQGLIDVMQT